MIYKCGFWLITSRLFLYIITLIPTFSLEKGRRFNEDVGLKSLFCQKFK